MVVLSPPGSVLIHWCGGIKPSSSISVNARDRVGQQARRQAFTTGRTCLCLEIHMNSWLWLTIHVPSQPKVRQKKFFAEFRRRRVAKRPWKFSGAKCRGCLVIHRYPRRLVVSQPFHYWTSGSGPRSFLASTVPSYSLSVCVAVMCCLASSISWWAKTQACQLPSLRSPASKPGWSGRLKRF